jgi:hypothetical protein
MKTNRTTTSTTRPATNERQLSFVLLGRSQAEVLRVASDQPDDECPHVATAARRVDRDVRTGDHGGEGDGRGLSPDAGSAVREHESDEKAEDGA